MNNPLRPYIDTCKKDYRHIICFGITFISLAFCFLFPNALPRLAETLVDFCFSAAFYVCAICSRSRNPVPPTVLEDAQWQFAEQIWKPIKILPNTWEEFKIAWQVYWEVIFTKENFLGFISKIGDVCYYSSRILLILLPLAIVLFLRLGSYKSKHCTDRKKASRPLKAFERALFAYVYPAMRWMKDFVCFIKENKIYWQTWLLLWCLHFNLISIVIALFAYILYFVSSWNLISLYGQLLKLVVDLTPVIRFLPTFAWIIIGVWLYNYICRSMAFNRLYHAEHANRAMLKDRGIVTTAFGESGIGKTQFITSMAISAEIEQFDMAFDIMVESDVKFPNFNWQLFRDTITKQIDAGVITNFDNCRSWVNSYRGFYDRVTSRFTVAKFHEMRKKHNLLPFSLIII